ncbi:GGDEF domain-containing protein [sulfur-oxidizing endosymbiont of Gigantopelta aegis]|uniref:GGDEF domain-containing protein n=1 Tax=sulfur-oxidizing endosymbiont of Gigantopelta aegis TaxID=2794934 RepID=UPI0018DD50CC|nr:GGDEF domain-containing protein [sulfur-oxidizing endosymbiont of Gigantopelta aegis]
MARKLLQLLLIILIASSALSFTSFNFIVSAIEKHELANEKLLLNDIRAQINLSFNLLDKLLLQKKNNYLELHQFAQEFLQKNKTPADFVELQTILKEKSGFPIELYIINADFKIIKTSFPPDLGLDFGAAPFKNIAHYLKKIRRTKQIMVGQPNIEFISKKVKIYSMSVLDDNHYLELAFIDPDINEYFKKLIDYTSHRDGVQISLFVEFWNNMLIPMTFIPEKNSNKKIALFQELESKTKSDQQAFNKIISEKVPYQVQTIAPQGHKINSYYLQLAGFSSPYIKKYSSKYLAKVVFDQHKILLIKEQFKLFLILSLGLTISAIIIFALYIRNWLITPINLVLSAIQKKLPVDIKKPLADSHEIKEIALTYNETLEHLKQTMNKLEQRSSKDPMTGLDNRRKFTESFKLEVQRAKRHQTHLALAMIDLDGFKKYNDFYGHQKGDQLLIEFAQQMQQRFLRPSDHLCRMGGDEFSILLVAIEPTHIISTFNEFQETWNTHYRDNIINVQDDSQIVVTASIGIYTFSSQNSPDWETAYQQADIALYRAKDKGRNLIELIEDAPLLVSE